MEYYFDSVGPKGVIRKYAQFEMGDADLSLYNLAFGDIDPTTGKPDHSVKSNNGDRDMIMSTIAAIVLEFTSMYPGATIFVRGFDAARTRLYQMGIASHFAEISLMFEIKGYVNGEWETFTLNTNYERFYATRIEPLK